MRSTSGSQSVELPCNCPAVFRLKICDINELALGLLLPACVLNSCLDACRISFFALVVNALVCRLACCCICRKFYENCECIGDDLCGDLYLVYRGSIALVITLIIKCDELVCIACLLIDGSLLSGLCACCIGCEEVDVFGEVDSVLDAACVSELDLNFALYKVKCVSVCEYNALHCIIADFNVSCSFCCSGNLFYGNSIRSDL